MYYFARNLYIYSMCSLVSSRNPINQIGFLDLFIASSKVQTTVFLPSTSSATICTTARAQLRPMARLRLPVWSMQRPHHRLLDHVFLHSSRMVVAAAGLDVVRVEIVGVDDLHQAVTLALSSVRGAGGRGHA